jgi:hypothetical protein
MMWFRRFVWWWRHGTVTETKWACPRCGGPVVGKPGYAEWGGRLGGQIYTPPNEAELVARCPIHGHAPWNTNPPQ